MALDERAFFNERPETRQGRYQCPKCRRTNDYQIRWVRRAKKDRPPAGANDEDRAKFAKVRDYLLSPAHPIGRTKARFFSSLKSLLESGEALDKVLETVK